MADDLIQVGCEDCGAPYGKDGWCDAVIPDAIWNSLDAGLLCFRCMTKRLDGSYEDVPVLIASGPYKDSQETWRLLGWDHGYKVGKEEAADALARKDAEIAALKLERDDYVNACKHSADDLMARDAEIVALQKECAELRDLLEELETNRQALKLAHAQLAALRERVDERLLEATRTLWAVVYSAGGSVSVTPEAMIKCGSAEAILTKHQWPDLTFTAQWKRKEE